MKYFTILLIFVISFVDARELHVGTGQQYATLEEAAEVANPGDAIIIHNGIYTNDEYITGLAGEIDNPIIIYAEDEGKVIYRGQEEAWHLTSCRHLFIYGIIFENQTVNGVNIDDGGDFDNPSTNITISHCIFRNIDATGNNDLLKMSGVNEFLIEECTFLNGADGGSGIDMVGCHGGTIIQSRFENMGSNSIQVKGGSKNIRILQNFFIDGGRRTLNLGGNTDLEYFRPQDAPYEAAYIHVQSNVIKGSWAAVAYTGSTKVTVTNNTFYKPENWVIRILQETVDTSRFVPCGDNTFANNIVYFGNNLHRVVNIGPNTAPETFTFANNLWYNYENPDFDDLQLPVTETDGITGKDPLFANPDANDFELKEQSPAKGKGNKDFLKYELDYNSRYFALNCSIGAFEPGGVYKDFSGDTGTKWYYDYGGDDGYRKLTITKKENITGKEMAFLEEFTHIGDAAGNTGDYYMFTSGHKVFFNDNKHYSPKLLYDFNLKKGDTLSSYIPIDFNIDYFLSKIDSVKFEYHAGKVRKVLFTSTLYSQGMQVKFFGKKGKLIEGIGSVKSYMFGNRTGDQWFGNDSLRCYVYYNEKGEETTEKFVDYDCDYLRVGTDDADSGNASLKVFPNPAGDLLFIQTSNIESGIVEIYDMQGKRIYYDKMDATEKKRVETGDFVPGGYIIKVTTSKKVLTSFFSKM